MKLKKDKHPWTTRAITWGGGISTLLCGGMLLAPWRFTSLNDLSDFKGFYAVDRNYYLMSASDQLEAKIAWSKIKADVCVRYVEMQKRSNTAGTATLNVVGELMSAGGAVVGCSAWPLCMQHAALRCAQLKIMAPVAMMAAGLCGAGMLLNLVTIALYYNQGHEHKKMNKKQKHRQEEAKKWTFIAATLAFLCPLIGMIMYVYMTDMMFQKFMKKVFYPWARLHVGFGIATVNCCLSYNTCCFATWNYWPQVFPCYKKPSSGGGGGDDDGAMSDMSDG